MNINTPSPAWHMLGELELPVATSTDEAVHIWLLEVLTPLSLSSDFLRRVLTSAQESVGHAFQSNVEGTVSNIHVSILAPHEHALSGKSWGFFHIERIEAGTDSNEERHHAIDFYLYVDGE